MLQEKFSDAALVLVGHGSTKNADSAAPVYQHASELRRRRSFVDVREAFWKQEPKITDVVNDLAAPRVFIVPLFICEGYFCEQVIPKALGFSFSADPRSRVLKQDSRSLIYCRPVGTHDSMTSVLLSRAREVVANFPFPRAPKPKDITLFIAGHGTEQADNSHEAVDRQANLIRGLGEYAAVHSIFMEEDPRIETCYATAATKNIVIVPFFISDGLHTQEDIPVMLGQPERVVQERKAAGQPTWRNPTERDGKLVWYAPAVGTEPHLPDVILERVREFSKF